MTESNFIVFVVDDDPSVLLALARLLRETGLTVETFESGRAFMDRHDPNIPGCLVCDLTMPGLDGLQLQATLLAAGASPPIIFLTGNGDIPTSVRALKLGAVDFLTKPIDRADLVAAIAKARIRDEQARTQRREIATLEAQINRLTPREREVLPELIAGYMNKVIAGHLGIAEKTIKVHRGRLMKKMGVRNVAELVRAASVSKELSRSAHDSES
jgi:FixJ family two-component response regulator